MISTPVLTTALPGWNLRSRGKVRDIYEVSTGGGPRLLIVTTDRISAFDVVLPSGIPGKGIVLTQISRFWFDRFRGIVPNHLLSASVDDLPEGLRAYRGLLEGRMMLVEPLPIVPFECVVRGYLAGSGWKEYRETGAVCGIRLSAGLRESDRLPEPIFTPATKEASGHDINVSEASMADALGSDLTRKLKEASLRLYREAAGYAAGRGILIADTKFEFGTRDGEIVLADEALTPDSSRFWPADRYAPGTSPPSFDKQFVRDWLETTGWRKTLPAPALPEEVVRGTSLRYLEAYERLTGRKLALE